MNPIEDHLWAGDPYTAWIASWTQNIHACMAAGAVHSVATNNNWAIAWPPHSSTKYTWHHPWNEVFIESPCNLTMCRRHHGLITKYLVHWSLHKCVHICFFRVTKVRVPWPKCRQEQPVFHTLELENPHLFAWLCQLRSPRFEIYSTYNSMAIHTLVSISSSYAWKLKQTPKGRTLYSASFRCNIGDRSRYSSTVSTGMHIY